MNSPNSTRYRHPPNSSRAAKIFQARGQPCPRVVRSLDGLADKPVRAPLVAALPRCDLLRLINETSTFHTAFCGSASMACWPDLHKACRTMTLAAIAMEPQMT